MLTRRLAILISLAGLHHTDRCAHAWSEGGHRVVASIAYDNLSPELRAKLVALLRKHPRFNQEFRVRMPEGLAPRDEDRWIFLQASIWPDLIRGKPEFDRPTWHYINEFTFLGEVDEMALKNELTTNLAKALPEDLPGEAVPETKLNIIQAIKLSLARLRDPNMSDEVKAIYICWLMHLVGDLHQPLHSTGLFSRARFNTESGDRGGNSIPVKQQGNLHSLWDSLLGRRITLNDVRGEAAAMLQDEELKSAGIKALEDLTPETWTSESMQIARSFTYSKQILDAVRLRESSPEQPLPMIDLPEEYLKRAGRFARIRTTQAGFRLAASFRKALE